MRIFFTLTPFQQDTHDLSNLHYWNSRTEWTCYFLNYHDLSIFDQAKIDITMKEVDGQYALRSWVETMSIIISHILDLMQEWGLTVVAFACTKYQKDSGNLPPKHFLFGI